jgi:hypothetical protein
LRTLLAMAKIPYFTMKHCAHWNGPFEGRREDPEKRGARNRRDLHRHTVQVTIKVTFRLFPGFPSVTSAGYNGNGFQSGGTGQSSTSSPATATVYPPTPVNFQAPAVTKQANGTLYYNHYTFQSSTGNLKDLSSCTVGEAVFYPGSGATYTWPSPMANTAPTP